jgi:hypothetical protein
MPSHERRAEAALRRPPKRVRLLVSSWLIAASLPSVCPAAEPLPRSVLIIDQLGPNGPFNTAIASGIRATVSQGSQDAKAREQAEKVFHDGLVKVA